MCVYIYIYIYTYMYQYDSIMRGDCGTPAPPRGCSQFLFRDFPHPDLRADFLGGPGIPPTVRGNHSSNTTCLTHVFFKQVMNDAASSSSRIRQATPKKTNEAALDK